MTNCPNCGAPIVGPKCEYCDTVFEVPESARSTTIATVDEIVLDMFSAYKQAGGNGMFNRIINNGLAAGILTPNEARDLAGYPRI